MSHQNRICIHVVSTDGTLCQQDNPSHCDDKNDEELDHSEEVLHVAGQLHTLAIYKEDQH